MDFGVYHRPGSEIGQADALSRMWQVEMKKGVISNAADAEIVEYLSGVDNGVSNLKLRQLVIETRQATLRNNPLAPPEAIVTQCAGLVEDLENSDGINVKMLATNYMLINKEQLFKLSCSLPGSRNSCSELSGSWQWIPT